MADYRSGAASREFIDHSRRVSVRWLCVRITSLAWSHAVTIEGTDITTSNHINLQDQMYHYLTSNAPAYQA